MDSQNLDIYKRALEREKQARKAAEKILEEKSAELFEVNQKLEKHLKEKASELKGVFENIVDAYVVMDLFGNVLKVNDAAIELLGFKDVDQIYNLNDLVVQKEQERVSKAFMVLLEEASLTNFQVHINSLDGTEKLVHINASLIFNEKKEAIAAQGIVRDITEFDNLQKQKERLLKQLEKSNEELHEYAHVVSHDLKSPLRSIYALVNWLKEDNEGKFDEDSLQNISLIESTLEKMEQLITDVLHYSSITSTDNKLEKVNIKALLDHIIEMMFIPEYFTISIDPEMPVINGDKTKLQQLFQNLIGNAIKYNAEETGLIDIQMKELEEHFQFSVKDNGIGIDEKYHKSIFDVFQAIENAKDSSGIGLSIVKKIVELHHGDIWVKSSPGQGTTFHFTLKK